jgi:hypothetical protein
MATWPHNQIPEITMSHMPCSISDDPYNDASDYYENKGVYANPNKKEPDELWINNATLAALITPHKNDKE